MKFRVGIFYRQESKGIAKLPEDDAPLYAERKPAVAGFGEPNLSSSATKRSGLTYQREVKQKYFTSQPRLTSEIGSLRG